MAGPSHSERALILPVLVVVRRRDLSTAPCVTDMRNGSPILQLPHEFGLLRERGGERAGGIEELCVASISGGLMVCVCVLQMARAP